MSKKAEEVHHTSQLKVWGGKWNIWHAHCVCGCASMRVHVFNSMFPSGWEHLFGFYCCAVQLCYRWGSDFLLPVWHFLSSQSNCSRGVDRDRVNLEECFTCTQSVKMVFAVHTNISLLGLKEILKVSVHLCLSPSGDKSLTPLTHYTILTPTRSPCDLQSMTGNKLMSNPASCNPDPLLLPKTLCSVCSQDKTDFRGKQLQHTRAPFSLGLFHSEFLH